SCAGEFSETKSFKLHLRNNKSRKPISSFEVTVSVLKHLGSVCVSVLKHFGSLCFDVCDLKKAAGLSSPIEYPVVGLLSQPCSRGTRYLSLVKPEGIKATAFLTWAYVFGTKG
uniref:Uncharacterized protein n=1 Tax=Brassica oleracea var. oleracea TaxID=109376 RepID=A0A0D2ZRN0_BRAOL